MSIHISAALSATVDMARVAAQQTTSVMVTVIDSQQLSLGTGFLVETAAKMAEAGCPTADIFAALNKQIKRSHVFAALDTLEFLKRSGRMNKYVAGFATLLQIKPILTMYNGKPGTERVRTRERAMQRLIEMLAAIGPVEQLAILHANALDRVAELRDRAAHLLPPGDILTANVTPVIGTHIGPGAVGLAVVGAE